MNDFFIELVVGERLFSLEQGEARCWDEIQDHPRFPAERTVTGDRGREVGVDLEANGATVAASSVVGGHGREDRREECSVQHRGIPMLFTKNHPVWDGFGALYFTNSCVK